MAWSFEPLFIQAQPEFEKLYREPTTLAHVGGSMFMIQSTSQVPGTTLLNTNSIVGMFYPEPLQTEMML